MLDSAPDDSAYRPATLGFGCGLPPSPPTTCWPEAPQVGAAHVKQRVRDLAPSSLDRGRPPPPLLGDLGCN